MNDQCVAAVAPSVNRTHSMNRWVTGLAVVLSSCSKDIAPQDFCDAYEELANCQRAKNCGWAAFDVSCDEILAKNGARRGCLFTTFEQSIDAGWLAYDGHAARMCLESYSRECSLVGFGCAQAYLIAKQPVGAPCRTNADCIDGACGAPQGCAGTCSPLSSIGPQLEGEIGCRAGLATIVPTETTGTSQYRCAAPVARGEVCWGPEDQAVGGTVCIETGDQCPQPKDGGSSVCEPYAPPVSSFSHVTRGGDCSAGIVGGQFCQGGLACRADGRCGSRIERGGSCALDAWGCEIDSTCADGLCVPMRTLGEPCDYVTRCGPDLRCTDTTCEKPRLEGAPCANDFSCEPPLRCVDGVCGAMVCR